MFGVNALYYQRNFNGLIAHNALDIIKADAKLGYGAQILAAHDFDAVRIETDFPTKTRGTGLWLRGKLKSSIRVDGKDAYYIETVYWHLSDIALNGITGGARGDVVALMGNTGHVNPKPSNRCQICPYYGTHVHFGVAFYDKKGRLIESEYNAGYRDPVLWMFKAGDKLPIHFDFTLKKGMSNDAIGWLQTCLKLEGFGEDYEPQSLFGPKTERDVLKLQVKWGLDPVGFVGPQTRKMLNDKYADPRHLV